MSRIVSLFSALRDDPRLQRDWERNQPRVDRALESPLIAMTPREVATAALLAMKLRFQPEARDLIERDAEPELLEFGRSQGSGGSRLAKLLMEQKGPDDFARPAAIACLRYYRDRSAANRLVRLDWTREGLSSLADAAPETIIDPMLKPTNSERKARGAKELARVLADPPTCLADEPLRELLRSIPGLGPERAEAVGVFGFRRPWPIVDENLWKLLARMEILDASDAGARSFDARRRVFEPHWRALLEARLSAEEDVAASLYLWANEAERFRLVYTLS